MGYKWCAVPKCTNTSVKTPNKLFLSVPKNVQVRRKWLKLSRRDNNDIANSTNIFFCEDHFDMENDMDNYLQYKMGFSKKIILKDNVLPSKFHCQPDRIKRMCDAGTSRSAFVKRQRMEIIKQCEAEDIQQPVTVNDEPTAIVVEACTKGHIIMVTLSVDELGKFKEQTVKKYTWTTLSGFQLSAISYGAIVQSILVPDKNGVIQDVVLGFDDLESYVTRNTPYLGAAVGRCANRIGSAKFEIDGQKYDLPKNVGEDALHGGIVGFDKVNWHSTVENTKVTFSYLSKDGEEGYPGDLVTTVSYDVTADDVFLMEFKAMTSKKTVVNLTNHSYFNLAGHDAGAEELYKHDVVINADKITETTDQSIPTGAFIPVGGTPFDFRTAKNLGEAMKKGDNLFDDNYCVSTYGNKGLNFVSRVVHPPSGRSLEVYSDQPGVQLYTANFLPSPAEPALIGKDGIGYRRHGAFCLETQNYPDAIHHANFPRAVLSPGEVYVHKVQYKFRAENSVEPRVSVQ